MEDSATGTNILFSRSNINDGGHWQNVTKIEPTSIASYSWSGPNSFTSSLENPQIAASATSSHDGQYTFTVTYQNNCQFSSNLQVTVNTPSISTSGTLNTLTACSGTNSSNETFSVSGADLQANCSDSSVRL